MKKIRQISIEELKQKGIYDLYEYYVLDLDKRETNNVSDLTIRDITYIIENHSKSNIFFEIVEEKEVKE